MKPSSILINAARGGIVNEDDLYSYQIMTRNYGELSSFSADYVPLGGRLPMCYAPVCHALLYGQNNVLSVQEGIRLACLRHAASVHPEPGSNSQ